MSKLVTFSYNGTPTLGTAIFVKVRDPASGSLLVARTNGGIREDDPGTYTYQTTLSDLDAYNGIWDENDGIYTIDTVIPEPAITVTGGGGGGGALPITGDGNADILGRTFLIKRGDTKPYIRRQLVDTNGNAIVLDVSDTVKFTMRISTDVAMASGAKTHASAVIIDATQGIVEYRWATADTNTTTYVETSTLGRFTDTPYAAEFEVTYVADSTIETFPQDGYIAVSMPPDLDPGINP